MELQLILNMRKGANFYNGVFKCPFGVLTVTTHVAVCAWVDINDECCGPVEWSRVVLPQEHRISRLDVVG